MRRRRIRPASGRPRRCLTAPGVSRRPAQTSGSAEMSETSAPPKSSPHLLLSELLVRKNAQTSLTSYIDYAQLGFVPAAHHRLLIHHLEEVERGECRRLMVLMPPGSAKSTYASQCFPAWYLGRQS